MPTYNLPTNITNTTAGLEQLFIYESGQINTFGPLILFFIFVAIMGGGYYAEHRRRGSSHFLTWAAVSSYITTVLGFILFLYSGIVNLVTVEIMMLISFIFTFALLIVPKD